MLLETVQSILYRIFITKHPQTDHIDFLSALILVNYVIFLCACVIKVNNRLLTIESYST